MTCLIAPYTFEYTLAYFEENWWELCIGEFSQVASYQDPYGRQWRKEPVMKKRGEIMGEDVTLDIPLMMISIRYLYPELAHLNDTKLIQWLKDNIPDYGYVDEEED